MEIYVFLADGFWILTLLTTIACVVRSVNRERELVSSVSFCKSHGVRHTMWCGNICCGSIVAYLNAESMLNEFNVRAYRMISWADIQWRRLLPNHNNRIFARKNPSNYDFIVLWTVGTMRASDEWVRKECFAQIESIKCETISVTFKRQFFFGCAKGNSAMRVSTLLCR